jgi:four helix bundle protein
MQLEELKVYEAAMIIAEKVWSIVDRWTYFQKDTVGKQLVRAVDSVAANLSEGFGRYHYKEKKNYGYYSRGSLFETSTWLRKAHSRKLIETATFDGFVTELQTIGKMLNGYIKSIGNVSEPMVQYGPSAVEIDYFPPSDSFPDELTND